MARRPRRGNDETQQSAPEAPRAISPRDAAIDALMALLAERRFHEIGLDEIAERAGLSLSGLRAAFPGKLAILAGFSKRIDLAVLAGGVIEGEGERDRLFDAMMRRFDALGPYRSGLKGLARSARRDPGLAAAVALISRRSMKWTLAAAGIPHSGVLGRITVTGAGFAYGEAMAAWLRDAPGNEKTMAALDGALRRGERAMGYMRDARDFLGSFGRHRRWRDDADDVAAAD